MFQERAKSTPNMYFPLVFSLIILLSLFPCGVLQGQNDDCPRWQVYDSLTKKCIDCGQCPEGFEMVKCTLDGRTCCPKDVPGKDGGNPSSCKFLDSWHDIPHDRILLIDIVTLEAKRKSGETICVDVPGGKPTFKKAGDGQEGPVEAVLDNERGEKPEKPAKDEDPRASNSLSILYPPIFLTTGVVAFVIFRPRILARIRRMYPGPRQD